MRDITDGAFGKVLYKKGSTTDAKTADACDDMYKDRWIVGYLLQLKHCYFKHMGSTEAFGYNVVNCGIKEIFRSKPASQNELLF